MRVVYTKLIIVSLIGLAVLSWLNALTAQQIELNLHYNKSFESSTSPILDTNQNMYRLHGYGLYKQSSVIVKNNSFVRVTPIDIHLSNVSLKRKKKVNYDAIVGGAIGFAVGFALGSAMYNSDSGVPVGGLVLAIPGTIIGIKMTSNKKGKTKRAK